MLSSVVSELSDLLGSVAFLSSPSSSSFPCDSCSADPAARQRVEFELHATSENFEKMAAAAKRGEARLKAKEEEVRELQSKVM